MNKLGDIIKCGSNEVIVTKITDDNITEVELFKEWVIRTRVLEYDGRIFTLGELIEYFMGECA